MLGLTWNWVMSDFKPDSWRQRELTVLFTKKNVRYIMWRLQGYNIVFLQTNTYYKTCFISGFRFFFISHLALKLTYRRVTITLRGETAALSLNLRDMFRHFHVVFSCGWAFNCCTFEFKSGYVTNYVSVLTLHLNVKNAKDVKCTTVSNV